MFRKLYVYGDSFVHGDTLSQDKTWANKLAEELDLEIYNRGVAGGSNKLSIMNLLNDLADLSSLDDILFIFSFTSMHRNCVFVEDHKKWYNLLPTYHSKLKRYREIETSYYKHLYSIPDGLYTLITQKLFVQSFLSQLNSTYFFINSFFDNDSTYLNTQLNSLEALVQQEKYLLGYENSIRDQICIKYGLIGEDGFHPSEDGHELAMQMIKNELDKFL